MSNGQHWGDLNPPRPPFFLVQEKGGNIVVAAHVDFRGQRNPPGYYTNTYPQHSRELIGQFIGDMERSAQQSGRDLSQGNDWSYRILKNWKQHIDALPQQKENKIKKKMEQDKQEGEPPRIKVGTKQEGLHFAIAIYEDQNLPYNIAVGSRNNNDIHEGFEIQDSTLVIDYFTEAKDGGGNGGGLLDSINPF